MDLFEIYKNFNLANREYINFIDGLIKNDLGNCDNKEVENDLLAGKNRFEFLKIMVDDVVITEENQETLGKLKYYIVDGLFLSVDLLNFYETKQKERFQMRAVNYINKDRMQQFINDNPFNSDIEIGRCRV